jgi:electron transport complex protein RnfB
LGYAALKFKVQGNPMAEKISNLLPHQQCGKCGYAGCMPYAEAIARGEAEINLCTPGQESTMLNIADLLGRSPVPLSQDSVVDKPKTLAVINENACIGCTLCIQACPVDAILGAAKQMHTVIASECTGCELCIPPCPVDCIEMRPIPIQTSHWKFPYPTDVRSL